MTEFKVGDLVVSDVTQRTTVYKITAVSKPNGKQLVRVAIGGHDLGGTFGSDLFLPWAEPMDDTRSYLDTLNNYVERTDNEIP